MTRNELKEALCLWMGTEREEWDNDGLLLGAGDVPVARVLLALDVTDEVAERALKGGFDLILTHHPMIFRPLKSVTDKDGIGRRAMSLLQGGVGVMSFHTRLDRAPLGVSYALGQALGLSDLRKVGDYLVFGSCSPIGAQGFAQRVKKALGAPFVQMADGGREITQVALAGGAGGDFFAEAAALGAHAYVTGEMSYHLLTDGAGSGTTPIAVGHYHSEFPVLAVLEKWLGEWDPAVRTQVFSSNVVQAC